MGSGTEVTDPFGFTTGLRFEGIGTPAFGPNDCGISAADVLTGGAPASRLAESLTLVSGQRLKWVLLNEELVGLKKGTPAAIGCAAAVVDPDPDDEDAAPGVDPDPVDEDAASGFDPEPGADDFRKLASTALAKSSRSIQSG